MNTMWIIDQNLLGDFINLFGLISFAGWVVWFLILSVKIKHYEVYDVDWQNDVVAVRATTMPFMWLCLVISLIGATISTAC